MSVQDTEAAVLAAADAISQLPMEQWRGMVLVLLQALERRATDADVWEQIVSNTELDLKQRRAVGRWPGSGRRQTDAD